MPYAPDLAGCALDGRYELHELIGEGTFGRVYRGYDRRLARPVAIKVIKPWWAEDPDGAESFEREAQLLGARERSGDRADLRRRAGRGGPVLRHRAGRGREPGGAPEARRPARPVGGLRGRRAAVPRARARARRAHRAPRHQAGQRPHLRPRPGEGRRSRDRAPGRGQHRRRDRHDCRHSALHGARAGERAAGDARHRRLQRRNRALRDDRRAPAVRR